MNLQGRKRKLAIALIFNLNQMYMQGAMALECEDLPKERRPRSAWMWPYLQRRVEYGHCDRLMEKL